MKGTGMLVRKFELNPKGDQSGRGLGFIGPLKATMLKQTWASGLNIDRCIIFSKRKLQSSHHNFYGLSTPLKSLHYFNSIFYYKKKILTS